MTRNTNRNPELEHEFRENGNASKQPLFIRDPDGVTEPYEFLAITRLSSVKAKGWKDLVIKIIIVLAAFAVGGLLLFGVLPWIIQQFDLSFVPNRL